MIFFQGYSTPDILQQNNLVANQEKKPLKWEVATDDLIVEEVEKGLEEKPQVLLMGVRNSQRRAVDLKLGLVQKQVATYLQEKSLPKAELKYLSLQIQKLNLILKVIFSTMFIKHVKVTTNSITDFYCLITHLCPIYLPWFIEGHLQFSNLLC